MQRPGTCTAANVARQQKLLRLRANGQRLAHSQVEVALQFTSLRLLATGGREGLGLLLVFTAQCFTFWKTTLYCEWHGTTSVCGTACCSVPCAIPLTPPARNTAGLYDIVGGMAHTGHNDHFNGIVVYGLTNCWWIIIPLIVMVSTGRTIHAALPVRRPTSRKAK